MELWDLLESSRSFLEKKKEVAYERFRSSRMRALRGASSAWVLGEM